MTAPVARLALAALSALVLMSMTARADRAETIEANREVQRQRIEQGRYTGDLTRREYRALLAEQQKIDDDIRKAAADGHISRSEYRKIHEEQIGAYRDIKADTNNSQVSWWRRWLYLTRN